jgi:hypothetical protein
VLTKPAVTGIPFSGRFHSFPFTAPNCHPPSIVVTLPVPIIIIVASAAAVAAVGSKV